MSTIFIIKSDTIKLDNYLIKDLPGSSGRLDVIARCILAALFNEDSFTQDTQIWIFLERYGNLIFDTNKLDYNIFPKTELKLAKLIVELIQNQEKRSFWSVLKNDKNIFDTIKQLIKNGYKIYVLKEGGRDFFNETTLIPSKNRVFVVGNQTGDFVDSEELQRLGLTTLSFGSKSYLASSIIRLIQIHLDKKK